MVSLSDLSKLLFSSARSFVPCMGKRKDPDPCPWNKLPRELHFYILALVAQPLRTAGINRSCQALSKSAPMSYVLLSEYQKYPALVKYIPLSSTPSFKVKAVYNAVIADAKKRGIDLRHLCQHSDPFSPLFLGQAAAMCNSKEKSASLRAFCIAVLSQSYLIPFHSPVDEQLISSCERWLDGTSLRFFYIQELKFKPGALTFLPPQIKLFTQLRHLNLNGCKLTYLPPEMKFLTCLTQLSLRGNPLCPENVKEICQNLSQLATIHVSDSDRDLIQMFKVYFPRLELIITSTFTFEEL
ncbi:MAG: leucine-rich repeat domain-containing protein [Verrucomicrobia bacterium]|nr:leucine-rich repeat domain-containing protein [Verrucomicrobiota bacterium]